MEEFEFEKVEDVAYLIFKWLYHSNMNYKGFYYATLWNIWHNHKLRDEIAKKYPIEVYLISMIEMIGEENTFLKFESTREKYKELNDAK